MNGHDTMRDELIREFYGRGDPAADADKLLGEARRLHEARANVCPVMPWDQACTLTIRAAVAVAAEARRIYAPRGGR